jgi:hypothetical protein
MEVSYCYLFAPGSVSVRMCQLYLIIAAIRVSWRLYNGNPVFDTISHTDQLME